MIRAGLIALGLSLATPLPLHAQAEEQCRLALLLGMDVSASVDEAEYSLQINGLISALLSPEVQNGFLNGPGPVAFAVYEWSGRFQQDMLVNWTMIRTQEDLVNVTEQIARATRQHADFPTALGYAIGFAAERFAEAPPCLFQTLDISGDGQNNDGFPPEAAYEHFALNGVTVNGLAIGGASREIELYYESEVIRGPGAFVEHALNHDHFEEVMRRKLERELRVMILGSLEPEPHPR